MKPGPLTSHTPPPVHPALAAGAAALCAGVLAWAWLTDWRWALSGLVVFLLSGVVAATRSAR